MNGRTLRAAALACAAIVGYGLGGAAGAATFVVKTGVYAARQLSDPSIKRQDSGSSASSVALSDSSSIADEIYSQAGSYSFASASPGALKGFSTATSVTYDTVKGLAEPRRGASAGAESLAEYRDSFILNAPGVAAGTQGRITADVLLDGALAGTGFGPFWNGASRWAVQIFVNDSFAFFGRDRDGAWDLPVVERGDSVGLQKPGFNVVFGQPNQVVLRLQTRAGAASPIGLAGNIEATSSAFTSDFGNTLTWEGISKLTVGDTEVTNFTAVSPTSGFDFRAGFGAIGPAPVPEPTSWALMILGMGFAGWSLRRRAVCMA